LKSLTTFVPKIHPAPLLFGAQASMFYGSDHMRSQKAPEIKKKVTFVWDFHFSVDGSHLVNGLDFRRKASMNTENFVFDKCSEWKIIKGLIEVLPRG
jgi:hypothetical protein